jgi:ribosomal protein S18 acetylase RimI-like enzyme
VGTCIRAARAEDAPFLAEVVLSAGRSHVATSFWDLFLAAPEPEILDFLARGFLLAPFRSWWHHAHFLIAEVGGVPAAALSGFAPDDPGLHPPEEALRDAVRVFGWSDAELEAGLRRANAFFTCTTSPSPGAWLVENVATSPAFRRRGLVAALVPAVLERGRAAGHPLAQLTVFIGNQPAQCAYEAAGFAVVGERRHAAFEAAVGCPGLARMERPL